MFLKKQPVYLNLFAIRFPVTAICSILHRITGIVIFLATPFVLWFLYASLKSAEHFEGVLLCLSHPWMKVGVWGVVSAFFFHTLAGVRHLIMDLGIGEKLAVARRSAQLVIVASLVAAIVLGVKLW